MLFMNTESSTLNEGEVLSKILSIIEKHVSSLPFRSETKVYDNKSLMQLLNIKDKYLKKLRDNGYIGFSRCGDKYWYSQADVDLFLKQFHYKAFSTNQGLPAM